MIDFDTLVLSPAQNVFGEPVTFTLVASVPELPSFASRGIYSERAIDVALVEGGGVISTAEKTLDIRLSEFTNVPGQGDRVVVRGITFEIEGSDADGQGATRLKLKELR